MNPDFPVLSQVLHFRLDALALASLTIVACLYGRFYIQTRQPKESFSPLIGFVAIGVAIIGSFLAEWATTLAGDFALNSSLPSIMALRTALLGATAAAIASV